MMQVTFNAQNSIMELGKLLKRVTEGTQEGLNYAAEEVLMEAMQDTPVVSGNLLNTSFVLGKDDTGLPAQPAISDHWGSADASKSTADYAAGVSDLRSEAATSSMPIAFASYPLRYALEKELEYGFLENAQDSQASNADAMVASLVRKQIRG